MPDGFDIEGRGIHADLRTTIGNRVTTDATQRSLSYCLGLTFSTFGTMTQSQKLRAYLWTGLQYALLAALVLGGKTFVFSIPGWTLIGAAVGLTGWALIAFQATRLNITPVVAKGGTHIVSGPYRVIRHPMYASVLLAAIGAVWLDPTWIRAVAGVLLVPTIVGKAHIEEELLRTSYPSYAEYAAKTKRIIPGVW